MKKEGKFYFLGEIWRYKLKFEESKESKLEIYDNKKEIIFLIKESKKWNVKSEIVNLLKNFLKKLIERIIFYLEYELKKEKYKVIKANKIKIKVLKSRFGSCSSLKNLNFNIILLAFKKELIFYVVVHEYCHLYYLNHSKNFWSFVSKFDKEFKKHRVELMESFNKILEKDSFWKKIIIK